MDPLTGAALAAALLGAPVAETQERAPAAVQRPEGRPSWDAEIAAAARRFVVPETWIRAVIATESAGDPRAVSPKGAMGLMQLMPETWREMRDRYGLGADPFDPGDNVMAGTAFLRLMYDRFGAPAFLAAYNAGPGTLEGALVGLHPLPDESRKFMARVGQAIGFAAPVDPPPITPAAGAGGLFFVLRH